MVTWRVDPGRNCTAWRSRVGRQASASVYKATIPAFFVGVLRIGLSGHLFGVSVGR